MSRSLESEERAAAFERQVEELNARLTSALTKIREHAAEASDVTPADDDHLGGENVEGVDGTEAAVPTKRRTDASDSAETADESLEKMRDLAAKLREEGERSADLQERLHTEQSRCRDFEADLAVALARVAALEQSGKEAMEAAGTEAARAAEAREGLEVAEAEVVALRARLVESEEEAARATELKATLEITRDALDELR